MRHLWRSAAVAGVFWAASAFGVRAIDLPDYVGGQVCAGCHSEVARRWQGSHHAHAMQEASEASVLGDFADAPLEQFGITSTFQRSGGKFMVRTDGPDGALHDYEIAYAFGVYPLQQYLIAAPRGRLQALGIAWDSRPKDVGGQRWFHLYPDRQMNGGERLHWTGRDQTWNYMCASCHSTGVKKNYDLRTDTYATTWIDIAVSCEACHGPGSRHVEWAQSANPIAGGSGKGLVALTRSEQPREWVMNQATGIAQPTEKPSTAEVEVCAACHARRKPIVVNPDPGAPFLDSYLPALLEPGLYHADGQIDGEVFEYGSFVQSRMFRAGVTCSDCHEPHGTRLRGEGNALCAQCHAPARFDAPAHHHHQPGSAGAQCVECHMPTKTYMQVDDRRDHSIRIPRPDASNSTGAPNACTDCHSTNSAEWAAGAIAAWFPERRKPELWQSAWEAGRTGASDAERRLGALILDRAQPAIARASAVALLSRYATSASLGAFKAASADPDPLVRAAAPRALSAATPAPMVQAMLPLLRDPVRAVRIEAARALAGRDPRALDPDQRSARAAAVKELVGAELVDADRAEAHLNLGLLDLRLGNPDAAEAEYGMALRLDPTFVPALINLADLDRMRGRDQDGIRLLRDAVAADPSNAAAHHALGLFLVRHRELGDALAELRRASELAPDDARFGYVYAVALNSTGASGRALDLLEDAHRRQPADKDVLFALVSIARQRGDRGTALKYTRVLAELDPWDEQIRRLVNEVDPHGRH